MKRLQILFFFFLLLNFSICVNEVNEVKNTFTISSMQTQCSNYKGQLTFIGSWATSENIPGNINFKLTFDDGTILSCKFTNQTTIICPFEHVKFSTKFSRQTIEGVESGPYEIIGTRLNSSIDCSSLYIYSNLLILFIMIFIFLN